MAGRTISSANPSINEQKKDILQDEKERKDAAAALGLQKLAVKQIIPVHNERTVYIVTVKTKQPPICPHCHQKMRSKGYANTSKVRILRTIQELQKISQENEEEEKNRRGILSHKNATPEESAGSKLTNLGAHLISGCFTSDTGVCTPCWVLPVRRIYHCPSCGTSKCDDLSELIDKKHSAMTVSLHRHLQEEVFKHNIADLAEYWNVSNPTVDEILKDAIQQDKAGRCYKSMPKVLAIVIDFWKTTTPYCFYVDADANALLDIELCSKACAPIDNSAKEDSSFLLKLKESCSKESKTKLNVLRRILVGFEEEGYIIAEHHFENVPIVLDKPFVEEKLEEAFTAVINNEIARHKKITTEDKYLLDFYKEHLDILESDSPWDLQKRDAINTILSNYGEMKRADFFRKSLLEIYYYENLEDAEMALQRWSNAVLDLWKEQKFYDIAVKLEKRKENFLRCIGDEGYYNTWPIYYFPCIRNITSRLKSISKPHQASATYQRGQSWESFQGRLFHNAIKKLEKENIEKHTMLVGASTDAQTMYYMGKMTFTATRETLNSDFRIPLASIDINRIEELQRRIKNHSLLKTLGSVPCLLEVFHDLHEVPLSPIWSKTMQQLLQIYEETIQKTTDLEYQAICAITSQSGDASNRDEDARELLRRELIADKLRREGFASVEYSLYQKILPKAFDPTLFTAEAWQDLLSQWELAITYAFLSNANPNDIDRVSELIAYIRHLDETPWITLDLSEILSMKSRFLLMPTQIEITRFLATYIRSLNYYRTSTADHPGSNYIVFGSKQTYDSLLRENSALNSIEPFQSNLTHPLHYRYFPGDDEKYHLVAEFLQEKLSVSGDHVLVINANGFYWYERYFQSCNVTNLFFDASVYTEEDVMGSYYEIDRQTPLAAERQGIHIITFPSELS